MRKLLLLLPLALAAAACDEKTKEEKPSAAAPSPEKAAAQVFAAPSSWAPRPLAVGQWARLRLARPAEPPSRITFRVVAEEGDARWIEVESNTPRGTVVLQALVAEGGRKGLTREAVKKVKVAKGDGAEVLEGAAIDPAWPLVAEQLGPIGQPDLAAGEGERADMKNPVGEFQGCFVRSMEWVGTDAGTKTKVWSHPDVPVIGFVRAEGKAGKSFTMDLMEMGNEGAKSSF